MIEYSARRAGSESGSTSTNRRAGSESGSTFSTPRLAATALLAIVLFGLTWLAFEGRDRHREPVPTVASHVSTGDGNNESRRRAIGEASRRPMRVPPLMASRLGDHRRKSDDAINDDDVSRVGFLEEPVDRRDTKRAVLENVVEERDDIETESSDVEPSETDEAPPEMLPRGRSDDSDDPGDSEPEKDTANKDGESPRDALEELEDLPEQLTRPAVKIRSSAAETLDPQRAGQNLPPLLLSDVVISVTERYPSFLAAQEEYEIQAGKELAAWGAFDTKIKAESINEPLGFYKTYRHLAKLEQNTWRGGTIYSQYRLGAGDFPDWYGERKTDKGGEFKLGFLQPFLRDQAIDERRTEILLAQLRVNQVEPFVQAQLLDFVQSASAAYWSWVAAGQAYMLNRELLLITDERNKAMKLRVEKEDLPRLQLLQNERLIASRRAKLIEAERKLQQSSIKLSVYLIDSNGQPTPPSPAYLPKAFPQPLAPDGNRFEEDVALAMSNRPEPRELNIIRQQAEVERAYGTNQLLPNLSGGMDISKDVGEPSSSKRDKTPFEMSAGLYFDIPLQRRKAWGKIRSSEAKIHQVALKQQSVGNKIRSEVQDAVSAMVASYERFIQARISAELAEKVVDLEREIFAAGGGDILTVALQETAALDAELAVIDALADYFKAVAEYRAALGLNPLEGASPAVPIEMTRTE